MRESVRRPGRLIARAAALIVDSIAWVLVCAACAAASIWVPVDSNGGIVVAVAGGLSLLGWAIFVWWSGAERGATPGMRLMEVELIDAEHGTPIGWGRFLARCLAYATASVTGIGMVALVISMFRDEYSRGWHDRLVGAIVVERDPRPMHNASPMESTWLARLDDGRCVPLEPSILIGRAPQPWPGEDAVRLVPVGEGSRTVSKTHLLVGVDDRGAYAIDRGSMNGSARGLPGNRCEVFPTGQTVRLESGDRVLFGHHWLEVLCP